MSRLHWLVVALCLGAFFTSAADDDAKPVKPAEPKAAPSKKDEVSDKKADAGDEKKGEPKEIKWTSEQIEVAGITIQPSGPGTIYKTLELPGEIVLNADLVAHVTPRVPGIATKVLKSVGDAVAQNEVLVTLESPELGNAKIEFFTTRQNLEQARMEYEREKTVAANTGKLLGVLKTEPDPVTLEKNTAPLAIGDNKSKLLSSYAAVSLARASWARAQKLKSDNIISAASYESAAKDLQSAEAEYRGASEEIAYTSKLRLAQAERALRLAENAAQNSERKLYIWGFTKAQIDALPNEKPEDTSHFEIRAPFDGVVLERHVANGERVEEARDAFVIGDLSTVWVNLRVYTESIGSVKAGQAVLVNIPGRIEPIKSQVQRVSPQIDPKTRSAIARITFENKDGSLRPGLFITGSVVLEEIKAPITVPVEAIQNLDGKDSVFVETGKSKNKEGEEVHGFMAQPVKLGAADSKLAQVEAGLEAAKPVVVKNSFMLKAEMGKGEGD